MEAALEWGAGEGLKAADVMVQFEVSGDYQGADLVLIDTECKIFPKMTQLDEGNAEESSGVTVVGEECDIEGGMIVEGCQGVLLKAGSGMRGSDTVSGGSALDFGLDLCLPAILAGERSLECW